MLIIHRYLLRQFLQVFLICFCSLDGLYVVIDAFANLEQFVGYADKHGGLLAVMGEYYGYRTLSFFDGTSGIVTLIAAMFTLALFQRYNELTALQAAGIPKWRIIKPIVAAAVVIAMLAAANREFLIPSVRDKLSLDSHDLQGEMAKELQPKRDDTTDILIRGKQTVAKSQQIHQPSFLLPPALGEQFKQVQAAEGFYRPAEGDRPGGYLLKGVSQPKDLARRPSLVQNGRPIVLTPHDYKWLKPDECFMASEITFEQLVGSDKWRQFASTRELIEGLNNPSLALGAEVAVAIHSRFLQPVLDVTLLLLGLPLILRRGTGNVFFAIGLCLVVVVAFMLIVIGCQYLGSSYLISPALASWFPVMIFVPLAMAMSDPLRE